MELEIVDGPISKPSQEDQVYNHLLKHGSITLGQAADLYHIYRLSERIRRIVKEHGVQIENRGRQMGKNYGVYFLVKHE